MRPFTIPEEFLSRGRDMRTMDAARHFNVSDKTIRAWRGRLGWPSKRIEYNREMPSDFPEAGPKLTTKAACRRWGASWVVIHRWHRENGSEPAKFDFAEAAKKATARRVTFKATMDAPRDGTLEARAADHLRTVGYRPVHRSDDKGGFDQGGTFWRAGNVVLAPADLIARAQRLGFNPDGWRIAA
jgi:hypothetical protein